MTNLERDFESRDDIEKVIQRFYEIATNDELIGHFFTKVMSLDMREHIPIIVDFWEAIVLDNPVYKRNAMEKHMLLHRKSPIEKKHMTRWVYLLEQVIRASYKGPKAELMITRSKQIGELMLVKIGNL